MSTKQHGYALSSMPATPRTAVGAMAREIGEIPPMRSGLNRLSLAGSVRREASRNPAEYPLLPAFPH